MGCSLAGSAPSARPGSGAPRRLPLVPPLSLATIRSMAPATLLGGDQVEGPVRADLEHVVVFREISVDLAVLDVRPVAADADQDRLGGLRGRRHRAGEGAARHS